MANMHSLKSKMILSNIGLVTICVLLIGGFSLRQLFSFLEDTTSVTQQELEKETVKAMQVGCELDVTQVQALVQAAEDTAKRIASSSNMNTYLNAAFHANEIAQKEAARSVQGAIATCKLQQNLLQTKVDESLLIAEYIMQRYGKPGLSKDNVVQWQAVNQYNKEEAACTLPQFTLENVPLPKQFTFDKQLPVVDEVFKMLNVTCTIFQKMKEQGDLLRVATSVRQKDGTRAVGTYIPALNPDGTPNPVIQTIMKGGIFRGRAFVVNAWYITAYMPIYDDAGQIIGALYVGVPQDNKLLKDAILNTRIGESGSSFVMDSQLNYLVHPEAERLGKNAVSDYGLTAFQDILKANLDVQPRALTYYQGGNKQVTSYAYFKDWDWLICVSALWDELAGKSTAQTREVLESEILTSYHTSTLSVGGRQYPLFNRITYLDKKGQEIIRLNSGKLATDLNNKKDEPWLQEAANVKDAVLNCGVHMSPDGQMVEMRVVSPVKAADDTNEGYIAVDLDWKLVGTVLGQRTYGKTGYSYLLNEKGLLVSHPKFRFEDQVNMTSPSFETLAKVATGSMLQGKKGNEKYTCEGIEKYVSFAPLSMGRKSYTVAVTVPVAEAMSLANILKERTQEHFRNSVKIIFTFIAICFALALIFGYYIGNFVGNPVGKAVVFAQKVSEGDFSHTLDLRSKDEIGSLVAAINDMVSSFKKIILQVQRSVVQVSSSSMELTATSKQHELTFRSQIVSTRSVLEAVEEISGVAGDLVVTMRQAASMSHETTSLANSGKEDLVHMEAAMHTMEDASRSISSKLEAIDEKAENITTVVTTIAKVADQTNLLSLNAAIEAEKAGEYGRGFMVVAREIRRLADQTAVATLDIDKMVKEMQSAVSAGVMEMDKFIAKVEQSVEDVGKISIQLTRIIEQVQALTPGFENINTAISLHSQSTQEIKSSMVNLSEEMEHIIQSLRESFIAIEQLNEAAHGLQAEISCFKTD